MRLDRDWRRILSRAWSVRLIILAGILTGIEAALPFFETAIRPGIFAAATGLTAVAALWARISVQKDLDE